MPTDMRRLVIVSNRLPISVKRTGNGTDWTFQLSSGGLVSALQGLQKTTKFLWIGWPGLQVEDSERQNFSDTLLNQYSALPVFIDEKTSDLHYKGFSNSTIWPLFHYLPGDIDFNNDQWLGYVRANELFADRIASLVDDGDCIWVHDYHLMLLPKMLRERCSKKLNIGFFLHIPFPASDVYRALPYRKEILEGLLASDLIGFHIYDYARHFIASCTRILGVNASPSSVEYQGRTIKVGAYPVGIEPEKFFQCMAKPETVSRIEALKEKFKGLNVIVGVERLDYIKGLTQKLLAFESFLEKYPEYRGKVVLLQIAIPSRGDVVEYQCLQNQVFELVGRINGRFSTLDYSPVQFIHNSVTFDELVVLYHLADVCLITSTRDGMNLVAYEYIASQKHKCGVLILSEFAGAAQSLNGSILINPWCISDISNALNTALKMSSSEKAVMHSHLSSYVEKFTAERWGSSFVFDLVESSQLLQHQGLNQLDSNNLVQMSSKKILLFTSNQNINDNELASLLSKLLQQNPKTSVITHLIGNDTDLEKGQTSDALILLNYNGELLRFSDLENISESETNNTFIVPEAINYVLNYYLERCPGSRIITDQNMIVWEFSKSDNAVAEWTSCELQINLEKLIGHQPLKVTRDEHCIIITEASFEFETLQSKIKTLVEESRADCIISSLSSPLLEKVIGKLGFVQCPIFKLQITPQKP